MTLPTSPSPTWLSLHDALNQAFSLLSPLSDSENIAVGEALNRVLSEDIVSAINVPPADNSAMDGYALYAADSKVSSALSVSYSQLAGMPQHNDKLEKGYAVRIMTGALIPKGADCVIMQENVTRQEDQIIINQAAMPGENIRRAGGDIEKGATVLTAGTLLTASHLVLLASMGIDTVPVYRKLKVGIMATGDELVSPEQPLGPGQIYESNRTGTKALLASEPVELTDFGIVADDKTALARVLKHAGETQDLVISSGGVSVGDADFVKELVATLGDIAFWKIAIKPGKPFAFGTLGRAVFCGVPGNPVSAFVTTQQIVIPVVRKLAGISTHSPVVPLTFTATLNQSIKRKPGREEFVRAVMQKHANGKHHVVPLPKQSSGVMTTVTQANCYIVVPAQCDCLNAGDNVTVQPFSLTEVK